MDSSVASLRSEIKIWERSFKSSNGRDPTIQDIKLLPDIAAKYKLYKKLSKAAQNQDESTLSQATSSPSTSHSNTISILPPREVQTTAPLTSYNPFSPGKNRGFHLDSTAQFANQFKSSFAEHSDSLPNANPFVDLPVADPPTPLEAVSRARKRLRGEPVSPSPSKGKKQRTGSRGDMSDTFRRVLEAESSLYRRADSMFVSDSPVKAPAGSRSFKLLFDEGDGSSNRKITSLQKSFLPVGRLFDTTSLPSIRKVNMMQGNRKSFKASESSQDVFAEAESLDEVDVDIQQSNGPDTHLMTTEIPDRSTLPLLPPSPTLFDAANNKQKSKLNAGAKPSFSSLEGSKTKEMADPDDEDIDVGDMGVRLKVLDISRKNRLRHSQISDEDLTYDADPLVSFTHRILSRCTSESTDRADNGEDDSMFQVELPDELRPVLSFEFQTRRNEEEHIVQDLLYGRRTRHYDPRKGGEIWDAGEELTPEDKEDADGEEDWEGEPIPWEIGEL